jgi:hypothetical protein
MGTDVEGGGSVLRSLEYIGTHPAAPNELTGIDVVFGDEGVTFSRRKERLGSISWPDVNELSAFSETTPRKVSFPAVLFFGLWAFLFKHGGRRVVLRIGDREGDWLFDVPGIKVRELCDGLAAIRARHNI